MPNTGISDSDIIRMVEDRILVLSPTNEVFKFHSSRKTYVRLESRPHYKSGRQQYTIRLGDSGYRKIGKNRLIWMMHTWRPVPPGHDIDHIDHDRTNDDISNLRPRCSVENRLDNYSRQQLDDVLSFFDEKMT